MSSPIVQIENAIKDIIAVDYASGYSGVDLTGRVIVGEVPDPPMIPFATVQFIDFIEEHGKFWADIRVMLNTILRPFAEAHLIL